MPETFGTWMSTMRDVPGPVGDLASDLFEHCYKECRECRSKERNEEMEWGVPEVVRDIDAHGGHPDAFAALDESIRQWVLAGEAARPKRRDLLTRLADRR